MLSAVKKFGNSAAVIIPKSLLAEFGAQVGDSIELRVENGRLVIEPAARRARRGWAEDAKQLAAEGEDTLLWPDLPNEEDMRSP